MNAPHRGPMASAASTRAACPERYALGQPDGGEGDAGCRSVWYRPLCEKRLSTGWDEPEDCVNRSHSGHRQQREQGQPHQRQAHPAGPVVPADVLPVVLVHDPATGRLGGAGAFPARNAPHCPGPEGTHCRARFATSLRPSYARFTPGLYRRFGDGGDALGGDAVQVQMAPCAAVHRRPLQPFCSPDVAGV